MAAGTIIAARDFFRRLANSVVYPANSRINSFPARPDALFLLPKPKEAYVFARPLLLAALTRINEGPAA